MDQKDATVRLALPADADELLLLLNVRQSEEAADLVDPGKLVSTLTKLMRRDGGVIGVIRGPNGIEGTVGMNLDSLWYSSAVHLNVLWLYVPVAHRRSTHCKVLLKFCKSWSDEVGVPLAVNEIVVPITEQRVELVGRQMPALGKTFLYNRRVTPEGMQAV